ncbi:MAG: hypothetical protein H0U16_09295 [Actinobacteria bacterium]|nr:hypothetical protein [Actinomycetota bacterium]
MNDADTTTHGYGVESSGLVLLSREQLPSGDMRPALGEVKIRKAESLLAEARWAVWPTNDPDTKRAALLAAIALEVKTPAVLRDCARGRIVICSRRSSLDRTKAACP